VRLSPPGPGRFADRADPIEHGGGTIIVLGQHQSGGDCQTEGRFERPLLLLQRDESPSAEASAPRLLSSRIRTAWASCRSLSRKESCAASASSTSSSASAYSPRSQWQSASVSWRRATSAGASAASRLLHGISSEEGSVCVL